VNITSGGAALRSALLTRGVRVATRQFRHWRARHLAEQILRQLEQGPDSPFHVRPPDGYMRGIDYFDPGSLRSTLTGILAMYEAACGEFPDILSPRKYSEKLNRAKLLAALKVPESGNKLCTAGFIPDSLRDIVSYPRIVWRSKEPLLPANDSLPSGTYYLKVNHGSGMVRRVEFPIQSSLRRSLETEYAGFLRSDFGVAWGEWWYNVFDREVFLEESVSRATPSLSLLFYVIGGEVRFISVDAKALLPGTATRTLYFDCDFALYPWQRTRAERLEGFSVSDEMKGRLLRVAAAIGGAFESIRVDLMLDDMGGIYLNELTHTSNAGRPLANRDLDLALGALWHGSDIYRL